MANSEYQSMASIYIQYLSRTPRSVAHTQFHGDFALYTRTNTVAINTSVAARLQSSWDDPLGSDTAN